MDFKAAVSIRQFGAARRRISSWQCDGRHPHDVKKLKVGRTLLSQSAGRCLPGIEYLPPLSFLDSV